MLNTVPFNSKGVSSFGKKIKAQEEPKSLPPYAFPGLQICQNCFCGRGSALDPLGELTALPRPPSWIKGEQLLRGGVEGKVAPPFSNYWICPEDSFVKLTKTAKKLSHPMRLLIQKLFWASDVDYKIASRVVPQTRYLHHIQGELLGGLCFFLQNLQTFLIEALSADTYNARRALTASCWLCRSVWQQLVALFNELRKQKLINNLNYCLQQYYH